MSSRYTGTAILVVISVVLLHIGLHGWTIDSLLPHGKEMDAALVRQSLILRGESSWSGVAWSKYPHLLPTLIALVPRASDLGLSETVGAAGELEAHLSFASRHLIAARLVIMLLAALALPLTYLLGRRLLSAPWAAVAVLFLATSLLMQTFAHQARPHAALMAPVLATLLTSERWARTGTRRDLLLVTLSSALVMTTLHSGALFLTAPLLAVVQRWRVKAPIRWPALLAASTALLFSARIAYPFFFTQVESGSVAVPGLSNHRFPHVLNWERFNGEGFLTLPQSFWAYDPVLLVASILGTALFLSARPWRRTGKQEQPGPADVRLSVLFAPVLFYLIVIGIHGKSFERFLIPVLPAAAVMAAYSLSWLREPLTRRLGLKAGRASSLVLTGSLLGLAAWPCVRLAWLHSLPDSYEEAAAWVQEKTLLDQEQVLISPNLDLPLLRPVRRNSGRDPLDSKLKLVWFKYLASLPDGALHNPVTPILPLATGGELPHDLPDFPGDRKAVKKIVMDLEATYIITDAWSPIDGPGRRLQELQGVSLARFGPWGAGNESSSEVKFVSGSFRSDVLAAERLGPVLEAWTLR